jgi:4-amino-4-deoxy-L-arabinose transferase-like glycosyltransferase
MITAGYALLLGLLAFFLVHFPKDALQQMLIRWQVINLWINFFCLAGIIVVCLEDIKQFFRGIRNRRYLWPGIILAGALVMVLFVAPHGHRIYYDEDIYSNVGQNIALDGRSGYTNYGTFEYGEYFIHWLAYNKEPGGWPFLQAVAFKIMGVHEELAFYINNLLYLGSIVLIFLLLRQITSGNVMAAAFGALVFACTPHNIIWSATGAAEPAAAFFAILAVWLATLACRSNEKRHVLFLVLLVPLATQMRMESVLVVPLVLLLVLLLQPRLPATKFFRLAGLMAGILFFPQVLHLYTVSGHAWGATDMKTLSLTHFYPNIVVNGPYFLLNREYPLVFTLLALVGLVAGPVSVRLRLFFTTWFLTFFGLFLFFYAGSYHYGADDRFALLTFAPLSILAGLGAFRLVLMIRKMFPDKCGAGIGAGLLVVAIVGNSAGFLPVIRQQGQEAWGARHDHDYALEFIKKIPQRSLVLTHNPSVFLLHGHNAIQTYAGRNDPDLIMKNRRKYDGHVYFYYNYWCNTQAKRNVELCGAIKDKYLLKEVCREKEQNFTYILYRIDGIRYLK